MSSDDNNVMAKAQNQGPNTKQDDFNMAKLKKSIKQEQKRSSKHKVAKLSPAEIRQLNHVTAFPHSGSPSSRSLDLHARNDLNAFTPPLTPDTRSIIRNSVAHQDRRPNSNLPTPPQSPAQERRGSSSSSRHTSNPTSNPPPMQLVHSNNHPSRTPSTSSYRGIATYRGPDITRTGSFTRFQQPSPQIVANPLSQFSRPRQSTLTSSSSRSNSGLIASTDVNNRVHGQDHRNSLGAVNTLPSPDHSPVRMSDSPVSIDGDRVPRNDDTSLPQAEVPIIADSNSRAQTLDPAVSNGDAMEPSHKQRLKWRKTFTGNTDYTQDPKPVKREHRRLSFASSKQGACLHAIPYTETKPGQAPQMRDSLRDELPSSKTSVFKDDLQKQASLDTEYGQHPAVRPLSMDLETPASLSTTSLPFSNKKGKEREISSNIEDDSDRSSLTSSVPSYSRCTCCGRVAKPGGFESELSPVMENENLRTNFNFEMERTDPGRQRRSASFSTNQSKYTPIIPMEVGHEMKQSRIEPMRVAPKRPEQMQNLLGVTINKPGDVIGPSSTPLAIMPRSSTDPRLSRFGSLHARKEEPKEDESVHRRDFAHNAAMPHQLQRFGSLYGMRNDNTRNADTPDGPKISQSQPTQPAPQARQYTTPNVHRPVRSSRLAYQEDTPTTPDLTQSGENDPHASGYAVQTVQPDTGVIQHYSSNAMEESSEHVNGDGGYAVDLSSFDGSFVHRSISRSATVSHEFSPTPTGSGFGEVDSSPQTHGDRTDSTPSTRAQIMKYDAGGSSEQGLRDHNEYSGSATPEEEATKIGIALSTPLSSPTKPEFGDQVHNTRAINATNGPLSSDAGFTNAVGAPGHRSTTIVKMVPPAAISSTSSQVSVNGQMKLGDWVLPESPQSATPIPTGSATTEGVRC